MRSFARPAWALLSVLALTASVRAEAPPPLGVPRPFAIAQRTDVRLANGVVLTLVPLGSVPKATVMVVERTGAIDEGSHVGLASFVADYLKEGAGERDSAAMATALADMGGTLEISAATDQTTLMADVLADSAPAALRLLADVIRRPVLPAREMERLRANAQRASAVQRSEADALAGDAFAAAIWGDHPYGRGIPTPADIAAYRVDDVRDFVAANFGAARTHLYVSGRFDSAAVEAAARSAFGDWSSGPVPTIRTARGLSGPRVVLIDRPGAPQSTLVIGQPAIDPTDPDYIPLSVGTSLLGGGLLSRLDQDLRERRGWTYGVAAHLSPGLRSGSWSVSAAVTTAHTAESVAAIFDAVGRLAREAPPREELKLTQNYRAGSFVVGASGRAKLPATLAFLDLHGLPDSWLAGYAANVYAVTPEQVRDAFARHLPAPAMTVVVVGDLAKVEHELRALAVLATPGTTWQRRPAAPAVEGRQSAR